MRAKRGQGLLTIVLLLTCEACSGPGRIMIQPLLLRATGGTTESAFSPPGKPPPTAAQPRLSYLSIVFERLHLRGFSQEVRAVAPGVQVIGAVRDTVKTVLRLVETRAGEALSRVNLGEVGWFPFKGEHLQLILRARGLQADELPFTRGLLGDASLATPTIQPLSEPALESGAAIYHRIVDSSASSQAPYLEVHVPLQPSLAVDDKPDARIAGGRWLLVLRPKDGQIPEKLAGAGNPDQAFVLRDGELCWREGGQPVTEVSYLIFSVVRARRYPLAASELGELVRTVDLAHARGAYGEAEASLFRARTTLAIDTILSVDEKNMERTQLEVRENRIRAAAARKRGAFEAALEAMRFEVNELTTLMPIAIAAR